MKNASRIAALTCLAGLAFAFGCTAERSTSEGASLTATTCSGEKKACSGEAQSCVEGAAKSGCSEGTATGQGCPSEAKSCPGDATRCSGQMQPRQS